MMRIQITIRLKSHLAAWGRSILRKRKITGMGNHRRCSIHTFPDHVDIIVPGKSRLFRKDLPDTKTSFNWKEVTKIVAFKRDCWTVDLICFVIEINKTETLELNENMIGWESLIDAIPHYLAGALAKDEWFTKVAFPAFKPCQSQIYSRPVEPNGMRPAAINSFLVE